MSAEIADFFVFLLWEAGYRLVSWRSFFLIEIPWGLLRRLFFAYQTGMEGEYSSSQFFGSNRFL